MEKNLCIFESPLTEQFHPLTHFRPVYDLRSGIFTLRQKIEKRIPHRTLTLHCRGYLSALVKLQNPSHEVNNFPADEYFFIDGGVLLGSEAVQAFRDTVGQALFTCSGKIVAARLSGANIQSIFSDSSDYPDFSKVSDIPTVEVSTAIMQYPWHLIQTTGAQIAADFPMAVDAAGGNAGGKIYPGVIMLNEKEIFISEGAKIKPGVILDAEDGPIFIGPGAHVMPNATIIGPTFIGAKSVIKIGAKVYENTSIGEVCKVGGEVEGSIIHSYSNKQHEGFLGHAYLAPWVNLGADTNNSDLKNNYGNVKVKINGNEVDTCSMFMGLIMGDHSKSAINTMFNTGTVVGVSCNVFGSGFPPKYIPGFSWGGAEKTETYNVEKALSVARRVMARRNISLSGEEEKVFRAVFQATEPERAEFNK